MEKYIPTPEDYEKAEEAMKPEQAEMTRKKEELMENEEELKDEITLISPLGEEVKAKNIHDINNKIEEGYNIRETSKKLDQLSDVGIDHEGIKCRREIKKTKKLFDLNQERDLLYLNNGLDEWSQGVNNYWYNAVAYLSEESAIGGKGGLRAELMKNIKEGMCTIPHTDSKDLKGLSQYMQGFLRKIKNLGYDLTKFEKIVKEFTEKIIYPSSYMAGTQSKSYRDQAFGSIVLDDKSKKGSHPLLAPFIEEIEKLEKDGQDKLPDWLAEQGIMAGYSAGYVVIYDNFKKIINDLEGELEKFKKFVSEKRIKDVPEFHLPTLYIDKLDIINKKIHKVNGSPNRSQ